MGAGHGPGHAQGRALDRSRLRFVLAVTVTVAVAEVVGALVTGSLALLADAGHMVTDAAALGLALSASLVASLPASPRRTFGYHRAEILAATVNALVLLAVGGWLTVVGVRRLFAPADVDGTAMIGFALVGLVANLVALAALARRREASLNMRAAWLEVLVDAVGSVLAVVAGLVIVTTGFTRADSLASLVIAALILPRSWALLRDSVGVLLESAPAGLDVEEVRRHLSRVAGVTEVHDLHAWLITSGMPALSVHVTVADAALAVRGVGAVLDDLSECVRTHFGIDHATFQVEPLSHREHEHLGEHDHA